jgi:hypothetical protein
VLREIIAEVLVGAAFGLALAWAFGLPGAV